MCRIVQDVGILGFYFSKHKYFENINFCRMSQYVGKLRCRIAQVPLYILLFKVKNPPQTIKYTVELVQSDT